MTLRPLSVTGGLLIALVLTLGGCASGGDATSWEEGSYHVQAAAGRDPLSRTHYPTITRSEDGIAIAVALPATGPHRIEEIRVYQGDRELARLQPSESHGQCQARYKPPPGLSGTLRVLARCNQHLLFERRIAMVGNHGPGTEDNR